MPNVLVIDDDSSIFLLVEKALSGIADVTTASTGDEGVKAAMSESFDVVLLDIMLPDRNGMAVFSEIHEHDRRLPIIFMTVDAASSTAIEAMSLGAFDYLSKPLRVTNLRLLVSRAIEQRALSAVQVAIAADESVADNTGQLFIGRSEPMLEVFKSIGRVSKQNVPVLVRGESGTGKELVARALFQYSHREDGPFLAVNCAALPDSLLESELFGHEKGAFTGADSRRIGKFEQCNQGTLFLDEIGDMAPIVQAKVLRVLQDQRFERIGGNNELKTDVRIVAATNRPLEEMVDAGDFREDLLYRLNAVTVSLPPLRERSTDIPMLIEYFLGQAKRDFNKPDLEGISPETVELLVGYDWPGNVRQLRAVVRRCVLDTVLPVLIPDTLPANIRGGLAAHVDSGSAETTNGAEPESVNLSNSLDRGETVQPDELPEPAHQAEASSQSIAPFDRTAEPTGRHLPELIGQLLAEKSTDAYSEAVAYAERYLMLRVLRETDGNQSRAAEILGITRGKLRDRIAQYDIRLESGVTIGE